MACGTCSKIRCALYGAVLGRKTQIAKDACYGTTTCEVFTTPEISGQQRGYETIQTINLGSDWKTFPAFIVTLGKALVSRFRS